jgi:hypothetical protein
VLKVRAILSNRISFSRLIRFSRSSHQSATTYPASQYSSSKIGHHWTQTTACYRYTPSSSLFSPSGESRLRHPTFWPAVCSSRDTRWYSVYKPSEGWAAAIFPPASQLVPSSLPHRVLWLAISPFLPTSCGGRIYRENDGFPRNMRSDHIVLSGAV